jgi:hypothetical protein
VQIIGNYQNYQQCRKETNDDKSNNLTLSTRYFQNVKLQENKFIFEKMIKRRNTKSMLNTGWDYVLIAFYNPTEFLSVKIKWSKTQIM